MSGVPQGIVDIPHAVARIAGALPVRAAWRNELGGVTFQLGHGDTRQFVKWNPTGNGIDLSDEVARLRWAAPFITVPRVLDEGSDASGRWIVTAGLPGRSAVDSRWTRDPATAVRAIGAGLRTMHDDLPVTSCPFDWSAEARLAVARARRLGHDRPCRLARGPARPRHGRARARPARRRAADRPAGGLPRRRLRAQHADRR
jgi:kanamycin kinase